MTDQTAAGSAYGVHSEVGRLRKVLVCAPGLAHRRLTPTNADDLLFDDVMWVENAQRDHGDFVNKLRGRGVEVVELHDLLAQTMDIPEAKSWLLDRKIVPNLVGLGLVDATRAYLDSLSSRDLAQFLIGGLAVADLPEEYRTPYVSLAREQTGSREYLMPPLPNTLYTRDTTCWLYGGLTLNPLYWPARHDETLIYKAIYTFHPDYVGATVWWGDPEQDWGHGHVRGRRHHADRQLRGPHGHERAHLASGHHPGRRRAVRARARPSGSSWPACPAAGRDAPRHGLHVRGQGHRHAVPDHRGRDAPFSLVPERHVARRRGRRRGLHAVRRRGRRGAGPQASSR